MKRFGSEDFQIIYQQAIVPRQSWLTWLIVLIVVDITVLLLRNPPWLQWIEFPLGLLLSVNICWLGFPLLMAILDNYLLERVLEDGNKINSELLTLAKFLARATLILIVIFIFAQTHHINLIGLVASLGIAGAAIVFASQKILEQILWSVVLYIDNPFSIGDYIHLPDRTLGRVEALGWRSTQVRLSGKNTLVIVPNSNLAQVSIENLTRARRAILVIELTFFKAMSNEEKALIEQLIVGSTSDIVGIDEQLTQVTFENITVGKKAQEQVKAQVIFFVLGAAEISMKLRKNLLEIARNKMIEELNNYGISFTFEEKTIDITQPMKM